MTTRKKPKVMFADEQASTLPPEAMARLLEVTQRLAAPFDLTSMLTEVVDAGTSVLGADIGTLWLYEPSSEELVIKVPSLTPAPRVHKSDGLVGECLASQKVLNVADCYADPRFRGAVDRATGYKTKNMLNVPLIGDDGNPVGVLQLHNKHSGIFSALDELVAKALAAQCAVAVHRTQMTEALLAKERLDEEVSVAREIQFSTLPTKMPELDGYDLFGHFLPANHAGGDLFDLIMLDGRLFMLLGDATGHGFGPALSATQMQAMLRVAFRLGADLDAAYTQVNNQLAEDLPDDRFITAFVGFLDPATDQVQYHSGGQGPILHYRAASNDIEWFKPTTFPVGAMEVKSVGEASILKLQPGDILALISDGVYEYTDPNGKLFGETEVGRIVVENHKRAMAELSDQLIDAAVTFGDGAPQADDVTIVLIKRSPEKGN